MSAFESAFFLTFFHVQKLDGAALNAFPIETPCGLEAFNQARRIVWRGAGKGGPRAVAPGAGDGGGMLLTATRTVEDGVLESVDARHTRRAREQLAAMHGGAEATSA